MENWRVYRFDRAEKVKEIAGKMLGQKLVTKQTGAAGKVCSRIFVVEQMQPKKEYYFAILLDRATKVGWIFERIRDMTN